MSLAVFDFLDKLADVSRTAAYVNRTKVSEEPSQIITKIQQAMNDVLDLRDEYDGLLASRSIATSGVLNVPALLDRTLEKLQIAMAKLASDGCKLN